LLLTALLGDAPEALEAPDPRILFWTDGRISWGSNRLWLETKPLPTSLKFSREKVFMAPEFVALSRLKAGRIFGCEAWSWILPRRSTAFWFRAACLNLGDWSWFLLTTTRLRELPGK
jgi:hypothetical protein